MIKFLAHPSQYPTDYWDTEKMQLFWDYVRWFLKLNMPWIMLLLGFMLAVIVTGFIVSFFFPAKKEEENNDIDVKYY